MIWRSCLGAACLLAVAFHGRGQAPPTFRTTTRLVEVNVIAKVRTAR